MLSSAALSETGCRQTNEDACLACPELGLWVVADGVGGQDGGEVASRLACEVIVDEVVVGSDVQTAILQAHNTIVASASREQGTSGMATTVVVLQVFGSRFTVSWVGDSRAYRWSKTPAGGRQLWQLTTDHSLVQQWVETGRLSAEEAENHPRRHVVLQALGQSSVIPDVQQVHGEMSSEDCFLLCSDGLSDAVDAGKMADVLAAGGTLVELTERMVALALRCGSRDNISVLLVAAEASLDALPPARASGALGGGLRGWWRRWIGR